MLRVAVPNKGSLSESAAEILSEAGYRRRTDSRDLTVLDLSNQVEFFFLRPKDIAIYVGSGELDLGITGRDLAGDSGAPVSSVWRSDSVARPSATPHLPARTGPSKILPACVLRRRTRTWFALTSPLAASRLPLSASTAPWRSRSSSALPTLSPT